MLKTKFPIHLSKPFMKKNLLGLSAAFLAILFSAFNIAPIQTEYVFQFDGTGNYQFESDVENEANWDFVSTNPVDLTCDNINEKACRIKVTAAHVNTSPSITLKSSANIDAALYDGPSIDTYYVRLTAGVAARSNQAQSSF